MIGEWLVEISSEIIFRYTSLTSGMRILEIGPGLGIFADICLKRNIEYYAVEPNQQMASALEKKGIKVIRAIVPPLPEFKMTFDAVVMIQVLEHMDTMRDAIHITQQIWRVLKPGGKLIISSPDYLNLRLNFFNCDFSHNYVTTHRRVKGLLINAGFSSFKHFYLSGPFSGFLCILISAVASRLPFGILNALFPDNEIFHRFYKLQLSFSRSILVIGTK
ncbi:MAG: class I SAM-dependent methyltransferase [Deltaproteobacteria bacterium]|nr:class I SAM-dependent methyltransferase [Deltaproteobacteria bacterium]